MKETEKHLYEHPLPSGLALTEDLPDDPETALALVTELLERDGLDPVTQLTGYLITEDPTYLSEEGEGSPSARSIANHIGRDRLLEALIALYLAHRPHPTEEHER